jgi:hypothetical protein
LNSCGARLGNSDEYKAAIRRIEHFQILSFAGDETLSGAR